jgi:hypothetical protein
MQVRFASAEDPTVAFSDCSSKSYCIPANVAFLHPAKLLKDEIASISVDEDNHRFRINGEFLFDHDEWMVGLRC